MEQPRNLNIGCGGVFHPAWVNIDSSQHAPGIIACDVRDGFPFADGTFEAVYHSHFIEHLTPAEARSVLIECRRVLKSDGIIRVVAPDGERQTRLYLECLARAARGDPRAADEYDWVLLEMIDQMVRTETGGEMGRLLVSERVPAEEFVRGRVGNEVFETYRTVARNSRLGAGRSAATRAPRGLRQWLSENRLKVAEVFIRRVAGREALAAFREALFRRTGEVHRWMYDRFSLKRLLESTGFTDVRIVDARTSRIPNFAQYELDFRNGAERKPSSLFLEAVR